MNDLNIIANFNVNDNNYVAIKEKNEETKIDEIYLFGYIFLSEDEIELKEIEDNTEYQVVLSRFKELCDRDGKDI